MVKKTLQADDIPKLDADNSIVLKDINGQDTVFTLNVDLSFGEMNDILTQMLAFIKKNKLQARADKRFWLATITRRAIIKPTEYREKKDFDMLPYNSTVKPLQAICNTIYPMASFLLESAGTSQAELEKEVLEQMKQIQQSQKKTPSQNTKKT